MILTGASTTCEGREVNNAGLCHAIWPRIPVSSPEGMSFDQIAQKLNMTAEQVYEIGTAFFDRAFATWTKGQDINRFKTVPLTLLISFAN
jgi:hypothetical protein